MRIHVKYNPPVFSAAQTITVPHAVVMQQQAPAVAPAPVTVIPVSEPMITDIKIKEEVVEESLNGASPGQILFWLFLTWCTTWYPGVPCCAAPSCVDQK